MNIRKFLGIMFMCHQRPDRSFFIKGKQMPLCARCTGVAVGFVLGIVCAVLTKCAGYGWFLLLLLPMIVDGAVQQRTSYESTNIRRLITGILGGIGIIYIFINIHMFTVWLATQLLIKIGVIK